MNCILLLSNGDIRDIKIPTKNVKKIKLAILSLKRYI